MFLNVEVSNWYNISLSKKKDQQQITIISYVSAFESLNVLEDLIQRKKNICKIYINWYMLDNFSVFNLFFFIKSASSSAQWGTGTCK